MNPASTSRLHPFDAAALRATLRALAAALPIVIFFDALRGRGARELPR